MTMVLVLFVSFRVSFTRLVEIAEVGEPDPCKDLLVCLKNMFSGTFLLIYFIAMFACGIPIFFQVS